MRATFRLFPWDVEGDPDAPRWLYDVGVRRVALAATYHGARVVTPRHPSHRIVELPSSARYLDDGAVPLPRGPWSFERARDELRGVGVEVDTWAVVGHIDRARPELPRVTNAYGDRLEHALCLSHASGCEFMTTIVRGAARASAGATLHLEALGWQPLAHGGLHDKLHGAELDGERAELLAWCTCDACAAAASLDGAALRAEVRAVIDGAAAGAAIAALGAARTETAARLTRAVVDVALAEGVDRVALGDVDAGGDASLDVELLVDCWGDAGRGVANLERAGRPATAYVDLLAGDPDSFAGHWARLVRAGADALQLYHAGLASTRRLRAAVAALEELA